ncbi:MAG: hypothetical protein QM642_09575 [Edaphocola sp.]
MEKIFLDKLHHILPQINADAQNASLPIAEVLAAHQQPAVTSIRYNPLKCPPDNSLRPVPWCAATARYMPQRPLFTADPLFHAGAYYVQEASSMLISQAFRQLVDTAHASLRVLDLCAAPGGKSTLLASLLKEDDLLVANEVIQNRAAILSENLSRWGQMNTWVTNNDPREIGKLHNYFDVMLVDAPCTGSGLWRKDPKAIGEWSAAHVKLCSERQKRILNDALPALKEGGLLIYATCSYSAEENEQMMQWLLAQNLVPEKLALATDWHIATSAVGRAEGYHCYPWQLDGEGFFMTVFRKKPSTENGLPELKEPRQNKDRRRDAEKKTSKGKSQNADLWRPWLSIPTETIEKGEGYYAIHPAHKWDYRMLGEALRIKKTGTALGRIAGKDALPDQELAWSVYLHKEVAQIPLSKDEALMFLKKEEVRKDNAVKGWQLATFEGLGLGWGKWLPNRMNNYLPKNLRIRMDLSNVEE